MDEAQPNRRTILIASSIMLFIGCMSAAWPSWYGIPYLFRAPVEIVLFVSAGYMLGVWRKKLGWIALAIFATIAVASMLWLAFGEPIWGDYVRSVATEDVTIQLASRSELARNGLVGGVISAIWSLVWFFCGAGLRMAQNRTS